ncbi:MAG TPA: hypothetical protein VFE90_05750 [Myxococcales bacterium]|nr:hypothetical protein [Myxococcales bacterium]
MNRMRLVRAAVRRKAPSPLGALARGLIAGAIGTGVETLFYKATARWAPAPARLPPGPARRAPEGQAESVLETAARRTVEGLMQRGPLGPEQKSRAALIIHYLFGSAWGGIYGLCRESFRTSPLLFGGSVWLVGDWLLLPALRLGAWPQHSSVKEHLYASQAHVAYGFSTAAAYALLRDLGPAPLGALPALAALQAWAWILRTPPMRLIARAQPFPQRIFRGWLVQKAALA